MRPVFLVVDKPPGVTSHDVVAMVRAVLGARKVGHTGTLDPFATGVLPLAIGSATRLIQYLDEDLKVYEARIGLGAATDTGDPTGEVVREAPVPALEPERVEAVLEGFRGVRMQAPPRHSAVKIRGRPSYAYAREGQDVRAAPRPVRIDRVELLGLAPDSLDVRITCGRGTYARVLADEIAAELGTAGHLVQLRRTRSGPFAIEGCLSLERLAQAAADRTDWEAVLRPARGAERVRWKPRDDVRDTIASHFVRPLDALAHLPVARVPAGIARQVAGGNAQPPAPPEGTSPGRHYLVASGEDLLAVAQSHAETGQGTIVRRLGD